MANSCALARTKLVNAVQSLRKAGTREKITTGVKAGFVSSVVTPMRAVVGNASWGGIVHLARNPIASAIDVVQATGRAAATGFKVKPHEFRDFANALDRDGLGVMARGFGKGLEPIKEAKVAAAGTDRPVAKFIEELRLRLQAQRSGAVPHSTQEYGRTVYKHPLAQTMADASFAILEAADRPWWTMAFDTSIYQQAKLYAIREGLTGARLRARSAELQATPTLEMQLRALDEANYATFKDKNVLSNFAQGVKQSAKRMADKAPDPTGSVWAQRGQRAQQIGSKLADLLLETTIPFTGVPSSVAGKMISTSPLGVLNPEIYVGTPGMRAQGLANVAIGAGMVAAGMTLYEKGLLTGALPVSKTEKAQWDEAGKQPYSVLIDGDWYGLKALGPAAASLFMGASLRRGFDEGESVPDAFAKGAAGSTKFLTQQTYLQQIGNIVELAQGGGNIAGTVASSLMPAPAIISQANRAIDPYQREQRTLAEQAKGRLPGGSFANPRRVGPTGPLPRKTALERVSAIASPFPITHSRDNPTLQEIRRLGVNFGVPPRQVKGGGKVADIPRSEWQNLVTLAGGEAMREIERTLRDPDFQRLDDDDKKKVLDDIVDDYRKKYRDPLKEGILAAAAERRVKVHR